MTAPSTVVLERPAGKRIAKAGSFCANANPQARQHNTRAALRMRNENLMNRWYQGAPRRKSVTRRANTTGRIGRAALGHGADMSRASDSAARGQVQTNRS